MRRFFCRRNVAEFIHLTCEIEANTLLVRYGISVYCFVVCLFPWGITTLEIACLEAAKYGINFETVVLSSSAKVTQISSKDFEVNRKVLLPPTR